MSATLIFAQIEQLQRSGEPIPEDLYRGLMLGAMRMVYDQAKEGTAQATAAAELAEVNSRRIKDLGETVISIDARLGDVEGNIKNGYGKESTSKTKGADSDSADRLAEVKAWILDNGVIPIITAFLIWFLLDILPEIIKLIGGQ